MNTTIICVQAGVFPCNFQNICEVLTEMVITRQANVKLVDHVITVYKEFYEIYHFKYLIQFFGQFDIYYLPEL